MPSIFRMVTSRVRKSRGTKNISPNHNLVLKDIVIQVKLSQICPIFYEPTHKWVAVLCRTRPQKPIFVVGVPGVFLNTAYTSAPGAARKGIIFGCRLQML